MNEQLQQALTDLINKSMSGLDAATGFLAAEIPDVVSQLLMWHGVYSFLLMITGLVFPGVIIAIWVIKIMPMLAKIEINDTGNAGCTYTLGNIIVFGISIVIVTESFNLEWLKIWIAPKVWLLEYAASLAK